jgi:hypothetical protein
MLLATCIRFQTPTGNALYLGSTLGWAAILGSAMYDPLGMAEAHGPSHRDHWSWWDPHRPPFHGSEDGTAALDGRDGVAIQREHP